jgi:hypothetical protein
MGEGQMRTTDSKQLGVGGMASSLISIYIRYIGICLVIANTLARGPRMGECEEVFMFERFKKPNSETSGFIQCRWSPNFMSPAGATANSSFLHVTTLVVHNYCNIRPCLHSICIHTLK